MIQHSSTSNVRKQCPFTLKMEVAQSSETLVSYHINAQCHNPGDLYLNLLRRENFKSQCAFQLEVGFQPPNYMA